MDLKIKCPECDCEFSLDANMMAKEIRQLRLRIGDIRQELMKTQKAIDNSRIRSEDDLLIPLKELLESPVRDIIEEVLDEKERMRE